MTSGSEAVYYVFDEQMILMSTTRGKQWLTMLKI